MSNLFFQYIEFVEKLLSGDTIEQTGKEIFSSKSVMESIQESITNVVNKHSQQINQSAYVEKQINVDCGSSKLNDFQLQLRGQEYDIFGNQVSPGCPSYGCCYDIQQTGKIKLTAINNSVLNESTNMFNKIEQTLKQDVDMTVSGGKEIEIMNDSINKSRSEVINSINTQLEQATSVDFEGDQTIDIISNTALKCVNSCKDPPSAGEIKQSLNVDILSQNIAVSSVDIINKNYVDMESKTKTEFQDTDQSKNTIFMTLWILSILFWIILAYASRGYISSTGMVGVGWVVLFYLFLPPYFGIGYFWMIFYSFFKCMKFGYKLGFGFLIPWEICNSNEGLKGFTK